MAIEIRYHRHVEAKIVVPVDGRTGQLPTGALEDGGAELSLANLLNVHDVEVGDVVRMIASVDGLSGSVDAETVSNNTADRVIESINDLVVTVDPAFNAEPNSEDGKFFEFEIIRKSPYRKFTFHRVDQTEFTPVLYVNGDLVLAAVSHPGGDVTIVTWGGGVLTFSPLGGERWGCEMEIDVDGVIEVEIDADLELRLTNINVLQDAPLAFFSADRRRFGSHVITAIDAVQRMAGGWWLHGEPPGLAVDVATVDFDRQKFVAGATNEVLFRVYTADNKFPPLLDGAIARLELRRQTTNEVALIKDIEEINAGVLLATLAPEESVAGDYYGRITLHLGGVPEKVLRTPSFLVAIR